MGIIKRVIKDSAQGIKSLNQLNEDWLNPHYIMGIIKGVIKDSARELRGLIN